jgi:hypothetical protein
MVKRSDQVLQKQQRDELVFFFTSSKTKAVLLHGGPAIFLDSAFLFLVPRRILGVSGLRFLFDKKRWMWWPWWRMSRWPWW